MIMIIPVKVLMQVVKKFYLFIDKGETIESYASWIESQVDQHFARK